MQTGADPSISVKLSFGQAGPRGRSYFSWQIPTLGVARQLNRRAHGVDLTAVAYRGKVNLTRRVWARVALYETMGSGDLESINAPNHASESARFFELGNSRISETYARRQEISAKYAGGSGPCFQP